MQRVLLAVVACVSTLSVPGLAQTVKPSDLVGTWFAGGYDDAPPNQTAAPNQAIGSKYETILTLKADSTWSGTQGKGRWTISGDSIWFERHVVVSPQSTVVDTVARRFALRDQQLLLGIKDPNDLGKGECGFKDVFTRIDSTKPRPPVPAPTVTIKPADLVGSWTTTSQHHLDTLTFQADSTWTDISHAGGGGRLYSGRWNLLPGDMLRMDPWNDEKKKTEAIRPGRPIRLQGSQLTMAWNSCDSDEGLVYERVR